ncbi:ABC-2 transporter permease [Paludicola sp. MB14-C6]|uniref:ABC-2 transporter permease n=1 Tax=Paludihabitans sp. MB14-C6 TaxID=3070656 RepID=UPI0027DC61C1|nr:ABC-2 transporter permease [Paludicola sp. MB14-C6]WMJ23826.1 ABC-2 transporter permease [Paludicola sp. MB14-C6]
MRGLLIKDFINLKRYNKTIIVIIIFFAVNAFIAKDATILSGMIVLLCSMMSITSFSYDEAAKWDKYALSMPISRKEIVRSKYVLAFILTLFGAFLAFIINWIISLFLHKSYMVFEQILICGAIAGAGMLFVSVLLPFVYKFGVEKARLIIFLVALIPMGLSFLLSQLKISLPSDEFLKSIGYAIPIVLLIIIYLSYEASKSIFMKKEL